MLRKKSRERGPNPYTAVRFHDGFVRDPTRHTVLTASQLPKDKVEMIHARLKTVTTGVEAQTLPDGFSGWRTTERGTDGKCYIVDYCGVEVALFYKRQLTEIVPEPGEKVPEGVLQDPKEAWQRLDLLGRSAEKSNLVLTQSQRRLDEVNSVLRERVQTLDDLNDTLTYKLEDKEVWIKKLESETASLEKEIRALKYKPSTPTKKSLKSKGNAGNKHSITRSKRKRRK